MEQSLGHYKIVSELGRGGMGVVYKAYEESLNRYVAIKVLGEHLSHDENFVKRFVREARAAAGLSHPNVIQIFFIGREPAPAPAADGTGPALGSLHGPVDRHYFVMEYVEGRSVHDLLKDEGAIDPKRAARIILQAASGLAAAHDQGLVHRDLKPANLLVTKNERVKIADFGLALAPSDGATRLTATNSLMGTPGYLSPEQCSGEPAGPRSDIYSLGMTFYEMLTGSMPFQGESPLAVLRQILDEDPPPLLQVDPDLDPRIASVVERMVAKEPNDRYQSCHQLVADLERLLGVAADGQPTAGLPLPVALPPLPGMAPVAEHERTMARLTGRPEDAPTRVAPPRPVPPPPPPPPGAQQAMASQSGAAAAAAVAAPPAPVAEPVVPAAVVASAAAAPSGRRRWAVIGGMAIMLVVAVSAAGLFLGRLADDDAADEKVVAESTRRANVDVKTSSKLGSGTASKTGVASSPSAALRPESDSPSADSTAAGDERDDDEGTMAAGDEQAVESSARTAAPANAVAEAAPPLPRSPGGGGASDAHAVAEPAAIKQQAARRPVLPENPRVSVIAVGEPLLAGAAEAALESQLARHGIDLYDERGILELRDAGGAMSLAPSELLGIVARRGVDVLVLIEVEPLRERDLDALGRYASATTSRVRVDAFLAAAGDGIGRGWSEQVEYAEANAERQADSAMGRVSTGVAEAIGAAWDSYRDGAR